jgi:hypothetical protein
MAILVAQNSIGTNYTFGTPNAENAFFGLANQAETVNFGGAGNLKIFDVSTGDTFNLMSITPIHSSNPVSISVSGNVVILTYADSTYTLGSFNGGESTTINLGGQSITISATTTGTAPNEVTAYSYISTQAGSTPTTILATPTAIVFDTIAPTIGTIGTIGTIAIASATGVSNGYLNAGDVVSVTVPFSEVVTVTGAPTLDLVIDTTTVKAAYSTGSGTNSLTFTYTILATDVDDTNGISIPANALKLASGTIKDAAGNDATLTTVDVTDNASYKVDTTAPTVAITTPATTNDTTPVIAGTAEAGSTVTVSVAEGANSLTYITTTDTTGSWAIGVTAPLTNGNHAVSVTAVDLAGNASASAAAQTLKIDTAAKATAIPVENGSVLTNGVNATEVGGNVVITAGLGNTDTWAKAGDTIELLLNGVSFNSAVTHSLTQGEIDAGIYDFTIAASLLGDDGTKLLSTKVSTFNTIPSSPLTVVVDKTLPTLTNVKIVSDNANPTLAKVGDTVTLHFTADEALGVTPTATILGQSATVTKGTGNTYTATYSVLNTDTEGAANFAINFADVAGNAGTAVTTVTNTSVVSVDKTAPTATIDLGDNALKIGETSLVTFTFSEAVTGFDLAAHVAKENGTFGALSAATNLGDGKQTYTALFTPNAIEAATNVITVTNTDFTDLAGNAGAGTTTSGNYAIDTLAPNTPAINSIATNDIISDAEAFAGFNISGTGEVGSTVTLTLSSNRTLAGGNTATVNASGVWAIAVADADVTAMGEGTETLSVIATDTAGNVSPAATKNIVIDTVLPTANFTAASDDVGSVKGVLVSGKTTDDTALVLSGTNEIGATVDVYDGANKLAAATVTGTTWTYTATVADGTTYNFNVKETDTAGNVSTATADFAVTGDTTPPTANFTAATDDAGAVTGALTTGGTTDDALLVLSGTNETGSTVNVYDGTTLLGAATVSGTGWTFTATIANARTYNLNVKETDAAGNTSAATADFVVTGDNIAPITTATLVKITSPALTKNATPVVSGTAEAGSEVIAVIAGATYKVNADANGAWSVDTGSATATSGALNILANNGATGNSISVTAKDAAGNTSLAASQTLVVDTTAPTLAITSNVSAVKIGGTATVTFTFSEDPGSTFAWDGSTGDVVVTGGTLSPISGTGLTRTATFTPTAGTASANASITVAADSYTDAALNNGGAGTTPAIAIDTLAPNAPTAISLSTVGGTVVANKLNHTNTNFNASATITAGQATGGSALLKVNGVTVATDSEILVGNTTVDFAVTIPGGSSDLSSVISGGGVVTVDLIDAAGNVTTSLANPNLTVDYVAPTAPSTPTTTVTGGTVVTNTLNSSNTNLTATATITAGQATGGTAYLKLGTEIIATDSAILTDDSSVTFDLGTASTSALQTKIAAGGNLTVVLEDTAGNVGTSGTLALTVDYVAAAQTLSVGLALSADTGTADFKTKTAGQTITATLSGALDATDKVWGSVDNGVHWFDITPASGTTAISWTGADATLVGSNTIKIKIVDAAGNEKEVASQAYVLDTTLPAAPTFALQTDTGSSSSDFYTSNGKVIVSGIEAGASWQYSTNNGGAWTPGDPATDGIYSFTLSEATFTLGHVHVKQTDSVGNTSTATTSTSAITIDNTAPTAPTITAGLDFKGNAIWATGLTVADGEKIWLAPASTTVFVANDSTITSSALASASIHTPTTAGDYRLFHEDKAGKISSGSVDSGSVITTITVDNTIPTSTITGATFIQSNNGATNVIRLTGDKFEELLTDSTIPALDELTYTSAVLNEKSINVDRLDWSQLVWNVADNQQQVITASDIKSVTVKSETQLDIELKPANALYDTLYSGNSKFLGSDGVVDTLAITQGFIRDKAGNTATSDALNTQVVTVTDTYKLILLEVGETSVVNNPAIFVPKIELIAPTTGDAVFSGANLKITPTTSLTLTEVHNGQIITLKDLAKMSYVDNANSLTFASASGATTGKVIIDLTGVSAVDLSNTDGTAADITLTGGSSTIGLGTGIYSIKLTTATLTAANPDRFNVLDTVSSFHPTTDVSRLVADRVNFKIGTDFSALGSTPGLIAAEKIYEAADNPPVDGADPTTATAYNIWINTSDGTISYDADGLWGTYDSATATFSDNSSIALIAVPDVTANNLYLVV